MLLRNLPLVCPRCHRDQLVVASDTASETSVVPDAIRCTGCGASYATMWGVPFLGGITANEILTLLEMVNAAESLRSPTHSQFDFRSTLQALKEYASAVDKHAVLKKHGYLPPPYWWQHRYREHLEFEIISHGLDFKNKTVLDVGAGYGSDSLRYHQLGAEVTCLEYSFSMFGPGKKLYPELGWVGAAGHALPFKDEQFDYVTAHNSLHHHTDQTVSLTEMLRVLKPGGWLITVGDPFRPPGSSEMDECRIFNDHPGVLSGINEQVPCFDRFAKAFTRQKKNLTGHVFFVKSGTERLQKLTLEDALATLPAQHGSIAFVLNKTGSMAIKAETLEPDVVSPGEFAQDLIVSGNQVFRKLAPKIDSRYLNLEFLENSHPKFRLLNGWKLHDERFAHRTAYKRARLFFSQDKAKDENLLITVATAYSPDETMFDFYVSIDGQIIFCSKLLRGVWQQLAIKPWGKIARPAGSFFVEIGFDASSDNAISAFNADAKSLFKVRTFEFARSVPPAPAPELDDDFGIESVLLSTAERKPLTLICGDEVYFTFEQLNRCIQSGRTVRLIVSDQQQGIYDCISGAEVIGTYSRATSEISPKLNEPGAPVDFIIERDADKARELFTLVVNNQSGAARAHALHTSGGGFLKQLGEPGEKPVETIPKPRRTMRTLLKKLKARYRAR